jgi:flagellar protein FlbT
MKAQLADLPILAKFLLVPAIAAVLMVVLGGLYVVEQRDTVALQERISDQDVPRLNELSRLFSQFSTNHVQFINLLAVSLRDATAEGQFYRAGRERILAVNRAIEELRVVTEGITHDDPTRALAQQLQRRLVEYRDQMGEAVLLSSVSLQQIARVALEANQAYDAANAEFLGLVAHVQDDVARQSELLLGRLQAARWRFFVALSVTIALIAVASVLLSRRFASDVASLMRTLDRLSAGDTKTAAPVRERHDEFGAVNKAVHAFRAALQRRDEAERALAALNVDLERRVERRTAQLAASRDEAERANQAKSEFLSRMSHELRTPMNAILGFGQLLERASAVPVANRGWVREIVVAGEHLLELINDVAFLLENQVMQVADATTPLRQLYFVVQLMLMSPHDVEEAKGVYREQRCALVAVCENPEMLRGLEAIEDLVEAWREHRHRALHRVHVQRIVLAAERLRRLVGDLLG